MDFGSIASDFERKKMRPRKFFENFGPTFAANHTKSHAPQRFDARHSAWCPLKLVAGLRVANRKAFGRDLARIRTQNFAAAAKNNSLNFRKFRSKIACNLTCRSMPTLGTAVGDL